MRVLVLNAGSSSLKASVIEGRERTIARASAEWGTDASRSSDRQRGLGEVLERLAATGAAVESVEAVGHRVVHGGERFGQAVIVDDDVEAGIEAVSELAPLHNAVALETLRAARAALATVPHVAAFDTSFHAGLPEPAVRYPLPESWYRDWGVRRFGFHGPSVAWSLRRAGQLLGRDPGELGLVVAHLGSGCSVTAVEDGRSVWTSMGMTPLEGLMMGTRAGSIDPGILTRLVHDGRVRVDELADVLDHRSGLLAVSGATADMRELEERARAGDGRAALAIDMFVMRAAQGIAAAATALPRLDALVFTGGIGEHAAGVRASIVARLAVFGLPPLRDQQPDGDAVLTRSPTGASVLRIESREDQVIAGEVEALLG